MQHSGLRQFSRTILTVIGIMLLIIFGARAASQASSLTAVGGRPKPFSFPVDLSTLQFAAAGTETQTAGLAVFEDETAPDPGNAVAKRNVVHDVKAAAPGVKNGVMPADGDSDKMLNKSRQL